MCDRVAEEIDRRILAGFPDLRTSSTVDDPSGAGNGLTLSVFEVRRRGKWNHFADFIIRCRQTGPGQYAIEVDGHVIFIEAGERTTRFSRDKIEEALREYRSLGVAASETTRYRSGIGQLGEAEDEVISRHFIEFIFRVARVVQELDRVEAGSTVEDIGERALARLKAMKKIHGTS